MAPREIPHGFGERANLRSHAARAFLKTKVWQTRVGPLLAVSEPSNWILLALQPPGEIDLVSIGVVPSFFLSDDH